MVTLDELDEPSPGWISHNVDFYARQRPDLYKPSKIDEQDFHDPRSAAYIKKQIFDILAPARHRKRLSPEFQALEKGLDLGPFGAQKVPLAPREEIRLFRRSGHIFAQSTVGGRFTGGKGPTTHTLRKLGTFFRSIEE